MNWGARFAVRDILLHLFNVDLTDHLTVLIRALIRSVHVNVHDMLSDHLMAEGHELTQHTETASAQLTRSRCSLCSSFTIKIMSKRDKIVVWKSMFYMYKLALPLSLVESIQPYLSGAPAFIIPTPHRVCSGKYARPGV